MPSNKIKSVSFKTMSMKAKLANFVRTELYPFSDNEFQIKYKGKKRITDQDKIDFFNKMYPILAEMNHDLSQYKIKRKYKALVQKRREERK